MPKPRPFYTSLHTTLAWLCLAVPGATGQGGDRFLEPDFAKKLFAREALLLERQEISSAVTALAALASNFPGSEQVDHPLRAKALAIALRLDGTDPRARATNLALSRSEIPEALTDFNTLDEVAQQLWTTAGHLESPEKSKDERVLQFCLVEIARDIDPRNLAQSNRYPTRLPEAVFPGWAAILDGDSTAFVFPDGDRAPDQNPSPAGDPEDPIGADPTRPARTAEGSYPSLVTSGGSAQLTRIRANLKAGGGSGPLAVVFSDREGETDGPLNGYRQVLVSALSELEGGWPQGGGVLVLTIDQGSGNDPALLLPSALLADSLIRERELDPRTAALGVVAPEGSLMAIDRLHQHLVSFSSKEIDTILVPAENLPDLQDLALLGELEPFIRYQIILVGSLKQAAAAAVEDHGDDGFAKAWQKFKLIREAVKGNELREMTGLNVVRSALGEIVQLNPEHASAALLLAHGGGELPQHLTRHGSLAALYRATGPVVKAMQSSGSADRQTTRAAVAEVTTIQPILHPQTTEVGKMMGAVLNEIDSYSEITDKKGAAAVELKATILSHWETVRAEYARLKNDG